MSSSGIDPVSTIKNSNGNILDAIRGGIAGLFTVIFSGFALGVDAITQVFVDPLGAFAGELSGLVRAYIPSTLLIIGEQTSATALSRFGILAYPVAMIVLALGLYVLSQLLAANFTSNLIPFSTTDFPIIGTDEQEEG